MDSRILAKRRMRQEKRRLERVNRIQKLTKLILFLLILLVFLNFFVISIITVEGNSMLPTFHNGDKLIFSKLNITADSLNRGEIVVFDGNDKSKFVKRVIGLPGELIEIKDGKVFVNGNHIKDDIELEYTYKYNIDKWYLKENEIFVLGDNRSQNDSRDSRIFGPIQLNHIEGKFLFKL